MALIMIQKHAHMISFGMMPMHILTVCRSLAKMYSPNWDITRYLQATEDYSMDIIAMAKHRSKPSHGRPLFTDQG